MDKEQIKAKIKLLYDVNSINKWREEAFTIAHIHTRSEYMARAIVREAENECLQQKNFTPA